MQPPLQDPYLDCPTYQTGRFTFRMIRLEDAPDLLACYADPVSARFFNSDNCTSDFVYHTLEEMQDCIRFWLEEYARKAYVRFSILDRDSQKAVGTLEMFARPGESEDFGRVGVLRVDLASAYETQAHIAGILRMTDAHFYELFQVDSILTKAIPEATERIRALQAAGYIALPANTIVSFADYYVKKKL